MMMWEKGEGRNPCFGGGREGLLNSSCPGNWWIDGLGRMVEREIGFTIGMEKRGVRNETGRHSRSEKIDRFLS